MGENGFSLDGGYGNRKHHQSPVGSQGSAGINVGACVGLSMNVHLQTGVV